MLTPFSKTCYAVIAVILVIAVVSVEIGGNQAAADPCVAQLSYPPLPATYSNSNVPLLIPISATCSTNYGNQLYATGNAYDTTSGAGLGSVSSVLQSVDGGNSFTGQLGFNLPPTSQGDTVQISVSIYNGQYGNQITATSETIQVGTESQQLTTTTVTQAFQYPDQAQYPTGYPYQAPSYQSSYQLPSSHHSSRNSTQYQSQTGSNSNTFAYVAIAAILATVIIATVGLVVVYGRRQQPTPATWIPVPPPPR